MIIKTILINLPHGSLLIHYQYEREQLGTTVGRANYEKCALAVICLVWQDDSECIAHFFKMPTACDEFEVARTFYFNLI